MSKTKKSIYTNWTKKKLKVLKELKRRDDTITTKGNNGGAIVIQDFKQYITEAERQLNNIKNYRPLPSDPTKVNDDTDNKTIKRFANQHSVKDTVAEGLITQNPKMQRFYTKPKLNKDRIPGKPVISLRNPLLY